MPTLQGIIQFVLSLAILAIFYVLSMRFLKRPYAEIITEDRSKQYVQVEVAGKDTREPINQKEGNMYIVVFRFADGSEKEFAVEEKVYESVKENDSGKLTYKESENIEKNFKEGYHFFGRHFISFEKLSKSDN